MVVPLLAYLAIPTGIALSYGLKDWLLNAKTKIGTFEMQGVPPFSWAFQAGQETRQGAIDVATGIAQASANMIKSVTEPLKKEVTDLTGNVTKSISDSISDITGTFTNPVKDITQTITSFKMPDVTLPSGASQILLIREQAAAAIPTALGDNTLMYVLFAAGLGVILMGAKK